MVIVMSDIGLSEEYGHDGSGERLRGKWPTEAGGVLSPGGRGDALLRHMPP